MSSTFAFSYPCAKISLDRRLGRSYLLRTADEDISKGREKNLSRGHSRRLFVTKSRTASVTPRIRETRSRTILTKNCRASTPASYAWYVESDKREGEKERERARVTIVTGRGHDTGSKKGEEKEDISKGNVQSWLHGTGRRTDGRTDGQMGSATTTVREKTSTHFTLDGRS